MIFVPYPDETRVINEIRKIRGDEYALLRLTHTMIDKNNLDANGIFRTLLLNAGIVDYEVLPHGGDHGVTAAAAFVQRSKTETIKLKFYRVKNGRGDRRFSIETIKRRAAEKEMNEGDLIYISILKKDDGSPLIYLINLTHNTPDAQTIRDALGTDLIRQMLERVKPKLKEILQGGFYNNSKGAGSIAPKDVGDTLEALLGIATNNRDDADYEGVIEVKAKGARTLDTLFTLRPHFEGTPIETYEKNDRLRVSAFARYYGYDSDKHPGYSSLYITIGSADAPQNNQGFFLEVDEEDERVNLKRIDPKTKKPETAAFWYFNELKEQLYRKHPSTLWVKAEHRVVEEMVQFQYNEIEFSRAPQFATFLSLIKAGKITYDWRGYISKTGKYTGKSHGNAWRIRPSAKVELFGEIEAIVF